MQEINHWSSLPLTEVQNLVNTRLALKISQVTGVGLVTLSGGAQVFLYAAIAGPLFWVCRVRVDEKTLRLTLAVLWVFHLTSSGFALLQVKYPGQFQPRISTVVLAQGDHYMRDLHFRNAEGEMVLRPMGLTDIPGGASLSGFYAVLGGIGGAIFGSFL